MCRIMRHSDINWASEQEGRDVCFYYICSQRWYFVEEENDKQGGVLDTLVGTFLGKTFLLDLCASEK